jgi:anaerobic ribonucleoside-triphosphate reductase activating protein
MKPWYENPSVKISSIQGDIISAGPGIRTEVFFYGCKRNCPGCINDWANDMPYRHTDIQETWLEIERIGNHNISIGGGEPFEQRAALLALLKVIRWMWKDANIILYTGNDFWDVYNSDTIPLVDVLITGPYVQEKAYTKLNDSFVGSSNQTVFRVQTTEGCTEFTKLPLNKYGRLQGEI